MIRLILFMLGVAAVASGFAWLADQPGTLHITFQIYEVKTSVFRAVVIFAAVMGLALVVWSILRQLWSSPAAVSHFLTRRRQRRGLDALSSGMIAIGAGDRSMATRYAMQARKSLPNEPLTHLLRAQAAQLSGDKATARRIFEAMLASPDTEQLGLRGLFLEAGREGESEAQRQFAERALRLNPKLGWPVEALFALQCKAGDWSSALETLATARRFGHVERPDADRRRAVLLTAQAQALEDDHAEQALNLALEAHGLAPTLIPAAAIAGRILAARGNVAKAAKVIQKTWSKAPHPELATAYAYARVGDSPRDRLERVKQLSTLAPQSIESWIAVAVAAIEAHEYEVARRALAPYVETGLTRRVAALLARVEAEEHGDKGRAREWLARAVNAPRDATWTADGVVSDRWAPVSPVTGMLDVFQWRVPVEEAEPALQSGIVGGPDLAELIAADEPPTIVSGEPATPAPAEAAPAEEPTPAPKTPPTAETVAPRPVQKTPAAPRVAEPALEIALDATSSRPMPRAENGSRTIRRDPIIARPHAPDDPGPSEDDAEDPRSPGGVPG